jgi:DNA polymerase III alpha subunit
MKTVKKQKIISIKPIGIKKTIDLEVNHKDHNFYAEGIVSSNSHSMSYAALAACTVYLKFKYPQHFFLALLEMTKHEPAPLEEISKIQKELRHFGITLLGPHILKSDTDFSIQGNNIRFGLSSIKGISEKTMEKLKNFKSDQSNKFEVFQAAKEVGVSIGVLSALIQAGALDGFSSSRSRVVLEAQLWNLLTDKEKVLSMEHGPSQGFDLLKTIKKLSEAKDENSKLLIKETRLETIKKKYDPYLKIYQQNNKSESFANWFYENKLLGYSYDRSLFDIFSPKMSNLITLKDLPDHRDNSTVFVVGKVEECSEWVSKNEKKTRTFKMLVSDEYGSIPVLTFNDKIDTNKSLNSDRLPEKDDIVIVKGTKKQDCIFAESFGIQTLKIYTKLSELNEKNLTI